MNRTEDRLLVWHHFRPPTNRDGGDPRFPQKRVEACRKLGPAADPASELPGRHTATGNLVKLGIQFEQTPGQPVADIEDIGLLDAVAAQLCAAVENIHGRGITLGFIGKDNIYFKETLFRDPEGWLSPSGIYHFTFEVTESTIWEEAEGSSTKEESTREEDFKASKGRDLGYIDRVLQKVRSQIYAKAAVLLGKKHGVAAEKKLAEMFSLAKQPSDKLLITALSKSPTTGDLALQFAKYLINIDYRYTVTVSQMESFLAKTLDSELANCELAIIYARIYPGAGGNKALDKAIARTDQSDKIPFSTILEMRYVRACNAKHFGLIGLLFYVWRVAHKVQGEGGHLQILKYYTEEIVKNLKTLKQESLKREWVIMIIMIIAAADKSAESGLFYPDMSIIELLDGMSLEIAGKEQPGKSREDWTRPRHERRHPLSRQIPNTKKVTKQRKPPDSMRRKALYNARRAREISDGLC